MLTPNCWIALEVAAWIGLIVLGVLLDVLVEIFRERARRLRIRDLFRALAVNGK